MGKNMMTAQINWVVNDLGVNLFNHKRTEMLRVESVGIIPDSSVVFLRDTTNREFWALCRDEESAAYLYDSLEKHYKEQDCVEIAGLFFLFSTTLNYKNLTEYASNKLRAEERYVSFIKCNR